MNRDNADGQPRTTQLQRPEFVGEEHVSICATGVVLKSLREKLASVWVTTVWLARWTWLLAIGIAWLATLGFAIYEFRFNRGKNLLDSLAGFAVILLVLGVVFVRSVYKFHDWWADQRLKSILKEIDAPPPTPLQRFHATLKEYESRVTLDFSEPMKRRLASSPTFKATVMEAAKLMLEAIVFQDSPHNEVEREMFQRTWQAKIEKFTERIAQDDPLAVEVILKAIEKESQGAGR